MDELIEKLRVQVMKHCIKNNISIRQYLLQIGENGLTNWSTLTRNRHKKNGQMGLLLKLLKFFNYDNKTENHV